MDDDDEEKECKDSSRSDVQVNAGTLSSVFLLEISALI
jgi:hypothetical protein